MKAININRIDGHAPIIDDSGVVFSEDMLTKNVKINNNNGYTIHNIKIKDVVLNASLKWNKAIINTKIKIPIGIDIANEFTLSLISGLDVTNLI